MDGDDGSGRLLEWGCLPHGGRDNDGVIELDVFQRFTTLLRADGKGKWGHESAEEKQKSASLKHGLFLLDDGILSLCYLYAIQLMESAKPAE
jgi:hypothetical protein